MYSYFLCHHDTLRLKFNSVIIYYKYDINDYKLISKFINMILTFNPRIDLKKYLFNTIQCY